MAKKEPLPLAKGAYIGRSFNARFGSLPDTQDTRKSTFERPVLGA